MARRATAQARQEVPAAGDAAPGNRDDDRREALPRLSPDEVRRRRRRVVVDADAVEIRVLGCLIEKQRTTPDQYPLSLNSLRLACNQSTNRDPIVDYDERTIKAALEQVAVLQRAAAGPACEARPAAR